MSLLRRLRAILTWKHFAWTVAITVVWETTARVGMIGNTVDRMSLDRWLHDVEVDLVYAFIFLMAILLVEGISDPRTGPSLRRYALAVIAAGALGVAVDIWALPFGPMAPGSPEDGQSVRRMLARYESGELSKSRQKLTASANNLMFFSLVSFAYIWLRRSRRAWRSLAEAELARSEAERVLLASRLSSAQAHADPEAILDRLARIEQTYEQDHAGADAMMDELIAFLRAAIPRLRNEHKDEVLAPEGDHR